MPLNFSFEQKKTYNSKNIKRWENECQRLVTAIANTRWPFNRAASANLVKFQELIQEATQFLEVLRVNPGLHKNYDDALTKLDEMILKYQGETYIHPGVTISVHLGLLYDAQNIRQFMQSSAKREAGFDIKFSIEVLLNTTELLQNPFDVQIQKNLFHLSNVAKGKPSEGKKLQGSLLCLVGAALMITGILIALPLLGLVSPVSNLLIVTGLYAKIFASSILGLSGISLINSGVGIFANGRRDGLSKEIYSLALTAETEQKARFAYP